MCGKVGMGVVRTTYIIAEQRMIQHVMPKVKPDTQMRRKYLSILNNTLTVK